MSKHRVNESAGAFRPLRAALQLIFISGCLSPALAEAAASCVRGGGVSIIGTEIFAVSPAGNGAYQYNINNLQCSGSSVISILSSDFIGTAEAALQPYQALNASRLFRNRCGSVGLIVHDNFTGIVNDGLVSVNMALSAHPLHATYFDEFINGVAPGEGAPLSCGCSGGLAQLLGVPPCAPPPKQTKPDLCLGNPIVPGQGSKIEWETDYAFAGPSRLDFKRYYDSQSPYHTGTSAARPMGNRWRHNHDVLLNPAAGTNLALMLRNDGQILHFRPPSTGALWTSDADIVDRLERTTSGWIYRASDDAVEIFDNAGRRLSRTEATSTLQRIRLPTATLVASTIRLWVRSDRTGAHHRYVTTRHHRGQYRFHRRRNVLCSAWSSVWLIKRVNAREW